MTIGHDGRYLFDGAQKEVGLVPVEAVAVVTTTYTKARVANKGSSPGGTAQSRGAVVNSGGV